MPGTWQELKGMDQDTFRKDFESGKYDDFVKDSTFLNAINDGSLFEKSAEKKETPAAVVETKPDEKPNAAEGMSSDPLWKQKGFASEQEFLSKFDNLATEHQKVKNQFDRLNAERGKEGLKTKKQLEAEQKRREQAEKELEALRSKATEAGVTLPEMPTLPEFDSDVIAGDKRKEYEAQLKNWHTKVSEVVSGLHKDRVESRKAIDELSSKVKSFTERMDDGEKLTFKQRQERELFNLIDEVDRFQASTTPFSEEFKTSQPFSKINQDILAGRASMYSDKDLSAFEKLKELATKYRTLGEDGLVDVNAPKVYETLDDLYLIELRKSGGLEKYLKSMEQKAKMKGREEVINAIDRNGGGARELPASGGERVDTVRTESEEESMNKLKSYAAMPEKDIENNPAAIKEYVGLLDKYAMGSAVPQKWRDKIKP